MQLKALADQLVLFNRLQTLISSTATRLVFKPLKSSSIFKPHVSYSFFNGNDKLIFILTGEYLMMNGMKIEISNAQHKKILDQAALRHKNERIQRIKVKEAHSSIPVQISHP